MHIRKLGYSTYRFLEKHPFLAYFIIAQGFLILSNLPLILRIMRTPAGWIFPLLHFDWPHDYYLYLSGIVQGQKGAYLFHDPYTSEVTSSSVIYILFVILGRINSILQLWPPVIYHVYRLIIAEIYLLLIFWLNKEFFRKFSLFVGSIFSLTFSLSPLIVVQALLNHQFILPNLIPWWISMDALERLNDLPHYLTGNTLFLLSILFLFRYSRSKKLTHLFGSILTAFIAGIFQPSSILPLIIIIPMSVSFNLIKIIIVKKRFPIIDFKSALILLIPVFALLSILVIQHQSNLGFPWNSAYSPWLVARWNQLELGFDRDLMLSISIPILFLLPCIVYFVRRGSWKILFLICLALFPLIILPFVNILGIPKIYLVRNPLLIPYAIILILFIKDNAYFIHRKYISTSILMLIFLLSITSSVLILSVRLRYIVSETIDDNPLWPQVYIRESTYSAIKQACFLIPENSVVLSKARAGNILPAFCPVISYLGHMNQTMNFSDKERNVERFYSMKLTDDEAFELLKTGRIDYVYDGLEEKQLHPKNLDYPNLETVISTNNFTLYRTNLNK